MRSLWNDAEAAAYSGDLGQRVYTSRLLGRESALVLHGGGNTSVKVAERNLVGEKEIFDVEYWDLEQAKLRAAGAPPPFAGEVALVTGAASDIGKATVE